MASAKRLALRGSVVDGGELRLDLEESGDTTTITAGDQVSTDPQSVRLVAIAGDVEHTFVDFEDRGDDGPTNAALRSDVDEARELTPTLLETGDAERFELRGTGTGDGIERDLASGDTTVLDVDDELDERGSAFVVGSDGDREYTFHSVDWNWTDDSDDTL